MALVKCESHGGSNIKPNKFNGKGPYSGPYAPVGHPDSGLICGATDCKKAGLVWLAAKEEKKYKQDGTDIFPVPGTKIKSVKVKVAGPLSV